MKEGSFDDLRELIEDCVRLVVEHRIRELDTPEGKMVHGSKKHIKSLEARIENLVPWRDRQKKGSEQRATYSRLIQRLKGELAAAKRSAEKQ